MLKTNAMLFELIEPLSLSINKICLLDCEFTFVLLLS
jgi:hypothetical protein